MRVCRLIGALFIGAFSLPVTARADGPLSMEEAVRLALQYNERSLKTPWRVEAAEGGLDRARTAFLPTLTAVGAGSATRPRDAAGSKPSSASRIFAASSVFTLSQPIVNMSNFPLYAQARHTLESEKWGAVEDKRLLEFDAARAFLTVLSAERLATSAKDKLERAKASLKDAAERSKAQLGSSNDVTLAQVDVASATAALAQSEGTVAKAYLQLTFLLGKPVSPPLAVPERTLRSAESGAFHAEDATRLGEDRRPDLHSAAEHTVSLREFAKEPLYRLAPTLGLQGQVRVNADPNESQGGDLRLWEGSATLTLTWNIYDAGVRYADRRTRVAQAESAFLDEKLLRRSIATDVAVALAALKAARDAYHASTEAADAARKHVTEVSVLYKQGIDKALDVVDANGRLSDAEVAQESAKLTMEQAYLDLRLAVGLDPMEDEPVASPRPPGVPGAEAPTPAAPAPAAPQEVKP